MFKYRLKQGKQSSEREAGLGVHRLSGLKRCQAISPHFCYHLKLPLFVGIIPAAFSSEHLLLE